MKIIPLIALLLLTGCTMPLKPDAPPDWPKLKRLDFFVPYAEMRKLCGPHAALLSVVQSCVYIVFKNKTCVFIQATEYPASHESEEHDTEHCAGHDHVGYDLLEKGWANHKATHKK